MTPGAGTVQCGWEPRSDLFREPDADETSAGRACTAFANWNWARAGMSSRVLRRAATAWLTAGAVLVSGCSTLKQFIAPDLVPSETASSELDAAWQAHARALARFQTWTMVGSLVVRSKGDASRVTMRWRQTRAAYHVRITALLGAGLLELEGSEAGVEAKFANGRRVRAESPETLLEEEVGWSVPLGGLQYWMVGAPSPGSAAGTMELDSEGRLARLEQSGWTVVYEKYRMLDGLALPARIRFSGGSVEGTVVVRRWKAEPEPT